MDRDAIKAVILEALRNANLSRTADDQLTVSHDAIIFGPGSPLNSMGPEDGRTWRLIPE